ncbi:uncharacterized protein (TIGR01440 family) [Alkalihalobacillus xiaoxiensis]|uniref:UPF0340 protein JOC54_003936 n=1 Tax=Shouchella xiaoxiensis TaxID=766895 RepID=A0ABS2SYP5_9BACI|nr:TIGR01440 family protein [Shouchella xiaoxiensis]MBM7840643.1 uncharacterized protein (TIGR01440 family) [Shouchella xiaoxiensis]
MRIEAELGTLLNEFQQQAPLKKGSLFVIGASTSEVGGGQIGQQGSEQLAKELYAAFKAFQQQTGVHLVFQCCEHLNRALVVEREVAESFQLQEVFAVPVRNAGGAMAAHAYRQFDDPVLIESISAHAGVDIGDTFIGMHLKEVVVPLRLSRNQLGSAHVTYATTRPKRIGGERAVYHLSE